jgi:hypothetical protein
MRIVFHTGAHCTDDERLLRSLLKGRGALAAAGVAIPAPSRYRTLLRDTAVRLNGRPASAETEALVIEQMLDADDADHVVLSWENFLSFPNWALKGGLYPAAAERMRAFAQIFPRHEVQMMLALRNPVTLVAGLVARQPEVAPETILAGFDPMALSWSAMLARVRLMSPGLALTVWCDEDAPLIWPEVLAAAAGDPAGVVFEDGDAALEAVMRPEGFQRYRAYMADKGHLAPARRRKVARAFLERFGDPGRMRMDIDLPGWTEDLVTRMTEAYHADCARVAALPGVRMIWP